MPCL